MVRPTPLVAAVLASLVLAGCGRAPIGLPGGPGNPTPSGQLVTATDADNGRTLNLHPGDRLEVKLASTYWVIHESSDTRVLAMEGHAVLSPHPAGCVPGAGCGLAIATFLAVGSGSAQVSASRNSCGEAMGCTDAQASFRLTIDVA